LKVLLDAVLIICLSRLPAALYAMLVVRQGERARARLWSQRWQSPVGQCCVAVRDNYQAGVAPGQAGVERAIAAPGRRDAAAGCPAGSAPCNDWTL